MVDTFGYNDSRGIFLEKDFSVLLNYRLLYDKKTLKFLEWHRFYSYILISLEWYYSDTKHDGTNKRNLSRYQWKKYYLHPDKVGIEKK